MVLQLFLLLFLLLLSLPLVNWYLLGVILYCLYMCAFTGVFAVTPNAVVAIGIVSIGVVVVVVVAAEGEDDLRLLSG